MLKFRYVDAEPRWAKQLEGEMTRGRHVITFRARSPMSSVSASCQIIIHVKDMEPPRVQQCPQSFTEMLAPGQSVKRIIWTEPVFSDNVKIQHVMASFLPSHYFSAGKHNILYTATDVDGNRYNIRHIFVKIKFEFVFTIFFPIYCTYYQLICLFLYNRAKCGFTITVLPNTGSSSNGSIRHHHHQKNNHSNNSDHLLPSPVSNAANSRRNNFRNYANNTNNKMKDNINLCDTVPNIENGQMKCLKYGRDGKRCSPVCNENHQFYQKFNGQPPYYLCLPPKRVDWKIRKFIPDCSPTHEIQISGRQCEAGWEKRGNQRICVACPPGMYRPQDDHLCQLCPKGLKY